MYLLPFSQAVRRKTLNLLCTSSNLVRAAKFDFCGRKVNMTDKELAELLFPNVDKTPEDYEKIYPKRDLKEGAAVSRFAPSPTGFVHMGSLLTTLIARKLPDETDGVFILRIEDTDQTRSVENGIQGIVDDLNNFDIKIDEGAIGEDKSIGNYGPYIQSQRKEIYECYANI